MKVGYGPLARGQVRVVNEYVSVDPYMRGRMNDAKSYAPPYALGAPMTGGAIGRVVDSASDDVPVGSVVLHQYGWRDLVQEDATGFRVVPEVPGVPLSLYLGILGMTGLTAYVGLTDIARIRAGDAVFVSGAAGAVGTAAGQFARLLGANRVIGSAGSSGRWLCSPGSTGTTRRSTTRLPRCASSSPPRPVTASTCSSTTSGRSPRGGARRAQPGRPGRAVRAISTYNATQRTPARTT